MTWKIKSDTGDMALYAMATILTLAAIFMVGFLIWLLCTMNNIDYARCKSMNGKFADSRCFVNGNEMFTGGKE